MARSNIGGSIGKGGPMPVHEDHVLREAEEKPAPNSYTGVSEAYQQFMNIPLGNAKKFSDGENVTATERRCRHIAGDPAPGDYEPRLPAPRNRGCKMSKAKRKDLWGSNADVPGVGTYQGFGLEMNTIRYTGAYPKSPLLQ
jgi:hypothetical protein